MPGIVSQLAPPNDYLYIYDRQDGTSVLAKASLLAPDQGCLCDFPSFPTYKTHAICTYFRIDLKINVTRFMN